MKAMHKTVLAVAAAFAAGSLFIPQSAVAQTTLTMSSWVPPSHHLTAVVLKGWADQVEKATQGRVKFTMLPKAPAAPPGTFDAVKDGLVDVSYVTASYTPARHVLPLLCRNCPAPARPRKSTRWLSRASTGSISSRSANTRA